MKQTAKKRCTGSEKRKTIIRYFLLTAVILFAGIGDIHAEDLISIYTESMNNDPVFAASKNEHQASREEIKQAYSELLPSVSLEAAHTNTRDDIKSSDNTVFSSGTTSYPTDTYTIAVDQPVFNYSSIVGVSKAKETMRQSDARLRIAEQELIIRVATVYFEALAAMDNYDFAIAEQVAVERNFELAKERHAMGLTPIQDKLDSKARCAYVSSVVIEAESVLEDSLQAIFEISGIRAKKIRRLKDELALKGPAPKNVESWVEMAISKNAVLRERKHAFQVASEEVRRIRAQHYPVIGLEGRNTWRKTDGSMFGGGSEVDTHEFSVRLSLPIYKGGSVNSQTRKAVHMLRAAKAQVREQMLAASRETRSAFLGVNSSLSKVKALNQAIEAQELTLQSKKEGFKAGLNTMINVLDAERDLYLSKRDYAGARYDYIKNTLRLKNAAGSLNEDDINMINGWLE